MKSQHAIKFFLILAIVTFCLSTHAKVKPNILWITHEDLSPIYGCYGDKCGDSNALQKFVHFLKLDEEPVALQAAISLRRTGEKAAPLVPVIESESMPIYSGGVWGRYKSWRYPMFIGMALDQTMINCGKLVKVR